jgi:hypothetical protein
MLQVGIIRPIKTSAFVTIPGLCFVAYLVVCSFMATF